MDSSPEGDLGLILLLLFASAFFSGAEAAFLALGRTRLRQLQMERRWGVGVLALQYRYRFLVLPLLLLGITLCNYMAEREATLWLVARLGPPLGPILVVVLMTIIVVIFAEVLPIHIGAAAPEKIARFAALLIAPLAVVTLPLVGALAFFSRGLLYMLGVRPQRMLPGLSEEHLKALIAQSEVQGVVDAGERRMLHGVLDFGDRTAAQIMTPRPDMICVEAQQTLGEALALGLREGHSRLPVYEGTPDDIIGILHLKDLLPYLVKGELDLPVRRAARAACHVPETLPADELLRLLQSRRQMMAIVKDEYGGTAGLVTIEDLLEEIVGEIADEYDREEPAIVVVGPTELLCDGRVGLHELEPFVRGELPSEDYESLAGVILAIAQRVPAPGEQFHWHGLTLTVEEMKGPRVEKVRVRWSLEEEKIDESADEGDKGVTRSV